MHAFKFAGKVVKNTITLFSFFFYGKTNIFPSNHRLLKKLLLQLISRKFLLVIAFYSIFPHYTYNTGISKSTIRKYEITLDLGQMFTISMLFSDKTLYLNLRLQQGPKRKSSVCFGKKCAAQTQQQSSSKQYSEIFWQLSQHFLVLRSFVFPSVRQSDRNFHPLTKVIKVKCDDKL